MEDKKDYIVVAFADPDIGDSDCEICNQPIKLGERVAQIEIGNAKYAPNGDLAILDFDDDESRNAKSVHLSCIPIDLEKIK
jgi:hypothetical protein